MKIKPKQYAIALLEELEGKKTTQITAAIDNFVRLLADKNDLGLADKIIVEFNKIWNGTEGIVEGEIILAREASKKTLDELDSYIKKITSAKKVSLVEKIDAGILGGAIVKYGDKVMNMSLRNRLNELKIQLIK
ncbi:MAG: ATP synthase subunit delta [Parcubacteria group bacterium GW2011_GWA2_43_9b]|uniref:ATP synthase subunit delta n=1 Tax=Candidatus Portnoybacteria bacterium RIFCSPLOWO2_02_FULL_39_11 TaxID=1802001 RepID=A0A1G2FR28_9BACT|nr:MAG: ATP synthase subunit delta [Parcubacteria group bacterium GW2011_GWA2_43_9b]OGZ40058.1 MAG: ATP synthase F1 subunit delta [Candidatus Portnoybacteria bacterium RIFCSPLOWO2_02_FULL_39_11]